MKGALKKLAQAGLAWTAKQATSLAKQRGNKVLDPAFDLAKKYPKTTAGVGVATGLLADAIFGGGDKEKQVQLLQQLKDRGVIGDKPTQVSEEEFWTHMERAQEQGFDPVSMVGEGIGVGGILGSVITPFVGGDAKEGISKNTADILSQFQQIRANRARLKEDTGFELGDELTLDDLYGEMGIGGMYRKTENFTDNPWQWLTGGVKEPTYGRGKFNTVNDSPEDPLRDNKSPQFFKTEDDQKAYLDWHNGKYKVANTPEEKLAALKSAPASYRKTQRHFERIHKLYKESYKGSDITSDSGKAHFKQFVQGILGTTPPPTIRDTATGVTSANPAFNPNARTPEQLIQSYLSPEGYEWDSEDAYIQSGMAPRTLNGQPSISNVASNVAASAATPAATPAVNPATIPAAVAASAAQPKTAAQQQQEYLASKNIRTATQNDADLAAAMKDPKSEFNAAMIRGGHSRAHAINNGYGLEETRRKAYQKAWGAGGEWDRGERGGENPLTGAFRDIQENTWDSYDAFRQSGALDGTNNYPEPVTPTPEPTFSWEQPNYSATADRLRLSGIKPIGDSPTPIGPTNGPENIDFGPLRKARATFYANKRVSDAAMAPTNTFDPVSAVRNMGRLSVPMELSRSARPQVVIDPTQTGPMMTQGGGLPLVKPMKRSKQRIQGQGYQYPNIPFGNQI